MSENAEKVCHIWFIRKMEAVLNYSQHVKILSSE